MTSRRHRTFALALAAVFAGASPAASQATASPSDGPAPPSFGEADYTWRVRPLGGQPTTLEEFRGRVLFINLWASWCTPCIRELGSIERLRERILDTDVTFLVVAAEGESPVRRFLRRYTYDLPFYLEERKAPAAFGVRGLPTTWIVDRTGRIVLVGHGEAAWDSPAIEALLRSLASGVGTPSVVSFLHPWRANPAGVEH